MKPRLIRVTRAILAGIASIAMAACSTNTAGIETTNGDDVSVMASSSGLTGTAPAFARLSLFDTAYVPTLDSGLALSTLADESGAYGFDSLPAGAYTIIAETPNRNRAAIIQNIAVGPQEAGKAQTKRLAPVGSLSGVVKSETDSKAGILVFLSGTGYYQVLSAPGSYKFEALPPGEYVILAKALPFHEKIKTLKSLQDSRSAIVPAGGAGSVDTLVTP